MSYQALHWAWTSNLTGNTKFVLIALADMADEEQSCFPGQKRLADMTGSSVETVRRALKELEKGGYIERERRNRPSGYRSSDRYYLQLENLAVKLPSRQNALQASEPIQPVNLRDLSGQSEGANEPLGNTQMNLGGGDTVDSPAREDREAPWEELHGSKPDIEPRMSRPDRCAWHQSDRNPPPCGGCREAREGQAQRVRATNHENALRLQREAQAATQERRQRIEDCPLCDDDGYLNGRPCAHDPHMGERARRGAELVREALGAKK